MTRFSVIYDIRARRQTIRSMKPLPTLRRSMRKGRIPSNRPLTIQAQSQHRSMTRRQNMTRNDKPRSPEWFHDAKGPKANAPGADRLQPPLSTRPTTKNQNRSITERLNMADNEKLPHRKPPGWSEKANGPKANAPGADPLQPPLGNTQPTTAQPSNNKK